MYYVEKTKDIDYLRQFDYMLFFSVLLMSLFGVISLRSALGVREVSSVWLKQVICLCIGVVAAVIISGIDYKDFRTLGIFLYLGSTVLLVLVLLIGEEHYGSQSWLKVPVIGEFQPSELSKVAFAVVVPVFFERLKEGRDIGKNVVKLLVYSILPIALVLMQPDVGTAIVFVFAFIVMLFIYGIPYRYFLIAAGFCGGCACFVVLCPADEAVRSYQEQDNILYFPGIRSAWFRASGLPVKNDHRVRSAFRERHF